MASIDAGDENKASNPDAESGIHSKGTDVEKPDAPTYVHDADPGKGATTHPATTVKHAPHKYAQTRGRVQSFIHVALLAKNLSELASLTTKHDEYEEWQVNTFITP